VANPQMVMANLHIGVANPQMVMANLHIGVANLRIATADPRPKNLWLQPAQLVLRILVLNFE